MALASGAAIAQPAVALLDGLEDEPVTVEVPRALEILRWELGDRATATVRAGRRTVGRSVLRLL